MTERDEPLRSHTETETETATKVNYLMSNRRESDALSDETARHPPTGATSDAGGHPPMSEAQARYLRKLCAQHGERYDPTLDKTQAHEQIARLAKSNLPTPASVRAVACPSCGAEAGQPCHRESHHRARVEVIVPKVPY